MNPPLDYLGQLESATHLPKKKADYIIVKVIQALNVLEQFHDDVDELSLTELSHRLDMHEGSLIPMLATLKGRHYLEHNGATNKFRLGLNTLQLAQTVVRQTDLYRVSHPVLSAVSHECGETASVAVLRKAQVIELDAVLSEHPVRVVTRVGVHLPVHCTAPGKALIATLPMQVLEAMLTADPLRRYTEKTLTRPAELLSVLAGIARTGYAVDDEELDSDVRSVAAVIRDYCGQVVGALVVTGPSCRLTLERIEKELVPLVKRGAEEISGRLGFRQQPVPVQKTAGADATPGGIRVPVVPRTAAGKRKRSPDGTPRAA